MTVFCVEMENGSIKTQTRVVFTQVLFLLLSIGCALRLPSSFCLIHSHQRLFADSRGFFLREHHSNGWIEINPSNRHLQLLKDRHTICWNWRMTEIWLFRSLCDPTRRMRSSYLPFIACVSEDDSVPEHKCEWLSLLSIVDSPIAPISSSSNAMDTSCLHILIVIVLVMFQE